MAGYWIKLKYVMIILIVIVIFSVCFLVNSKQAENTADIEVDFQKSSLADFKVQGEKVYFYCNLTLLNHSDTPKNVKLTAESSEDVKGGLLKDKIIDGFCWEPGFDAISSYNIFTVSANSQPTEVKAVFIGEYDFRNVKHDRNIPDVIKIETVP